MLCQKQLKLLIAYVPGRNQQQSLGTPAQEVSIDVVRILRHNDHVIAVGLTSEIQVARSVAVDQRLAVPRLAAGCREPGNGATWQLCINKKSHDATGPKRPEWTTFAA